MFYKFPYFFYFHMFLSVKTFWNFLTNRVRALQRRSFNIFSYFISTLRKDTKRRSSYNRLIRDNKTSILNSAEGIVGECAKSNCIECVGLVIYAIKKARFYTRSNGWKVCSKTKVLACFQFLLRSFYFFLEKY